MTPKEKKKLFSPRKKKHSSIGVRTTDDLPPAMRSKKRPLKKRGITVDPRDLLSNQEIAFCQHYVANGFNRLEAAREAGFTNVQLSVQVHRMLKREPILAEIRRVRDELLASYQVTAERIVAEIAIQAFYDPAEFYDKKGNLLPVNQMSPEARRALVSQEIVEGNEGRVKKIKSAARLPALELLARISGITHPDAIDPKPSTRISIETARQLMYDVESRRSEVLSEDEVGPGASSLSSDESSALDSGAVETSAKEVAE